MPGLGSLTNDTATTPFRRTHIRFDVDELVAQQPAWSIERELEAIVPVYDGSTLASTNMEFVPGLGWGLQSLHSYSNNVHETGAPVEILNVPSGYSNKATWAQSTDAGVTYAAGVTTSGDLFYSRDFAAGDTLSSGNYNLVSDQTSFPPAIQNSNAPMYRVGVSAGPMGQVQTMFAFEVHGNPKSAPDYAASYMFNGVLGWDPNPAGYQSTGYFCIAFRGDARCELWVYLTAGSSEVWKLVRTAWYSDPNQVHNRVHRVIITAVPGRYPSVSGGKILFKFTNAGTPIQTAPQGAYTGILGLNQSQTGDITNFHFQWTAPGVTGTPAQPNFPARVDTRQDLDVGYQVAQTTFQTTGNLFDQLFSLPFLCDISQPLDIVFWGTFAEGSVTAQIYAATTPTTGSPAYTALTLLSGGGASGSTFQPIAGQRFYGVNFTYSGPGSATAYLYGYRVFRNGVLITVSPGEFEPAFQPTGPSPQLRTSCATGPLAITIPDNQPSTSQASFMLEDFNGSFPKLQARGDFPIIIETEYVQGNSVPRVIRHRGYARLPESSQIGNHPGGGWNTGLAQNGPVQQFNYGQRFKVQVQCTGMWQRLSEALMPVRCNFAIGPDSTESSVVPFKVTDAMRQLFYFAGYDDSQLDIPDLQIRLFPTGDGDNLVIEPQASISELLIRWAKEYFGGYIFPEPNAGTYGQWLLLLQQATPVPTTAFVAAFTTAAPSGSGTHVQNNLNSYGTITINGKTMPMVPVFKGSLKWTPKPPEGNYVETFGPQENGGGSSAGLPSIVSFNTVSFKFSGFPAAANPDPNSPDWLSRPRPIYEYLPTFAATDQNVWTSPLTFANRRTYDVGCHGRLTKTIVAPEFFIADPEGYMREPRFYDPVYVLNPNGTYDACLIRSVAPREVKDDHQMCAFVVELLLPNIPPQVSRTNGITSYREALQKNALGPLSEIVNSPRHYANEKRMYGAQASALSLGAIRTGPIQNSNGTFIWTLDYDPVG